MSQQVTERNAGWPLQFRILGPRQWPGVREFVSGAFTNAIMNRKSIKFTAILLVGGIFNGCSQRDAGTHILLIKPVRADKPIVAITNYVAADLTTFSVPNFDAIPVSRWREAYGNFSAALIDEAKKCRLDSVSLSNCFKAVLTSPESQGMALLPVAALGESQGGQKLWTVELRWETDDPHFSAEPMSHVRAHVFTQNEIKQIGFSRCR